MTVPILEIRDLKTYFSGEFGDIRSVDGVSLSINAGETLGIVGESGSGKSVTSLSVMRLIASPPGRYAGGEILFEGKDLLQLDKGEMRKLRGKQISMIYQEPMTSLNPVYTVGEQIAETLRMHEKLPAKAAFEKAIAMLRQPGKSGTLAIIHMIKIKANIDIIIKTGLQPKDSPKIVPIGTPKLRAIGVPTIAIAVARPFNSWGTILLAYPVSMLQTIPAPTPAKKRATKVKV